MSTRVDDVNDSAMVRAAFSLLAQKHGFTMAGDSAEAPGLRISPDSKEEKGMHISRQQGWLARITGLAIGMPLGILIGGLTAWLTLVR